MLRTPVLIAGGGPVGLVLARELSWRGVDCVIAERNPTTTSFPKMDITNVRSMEHFRRLGFADELRAAGVPEENSFAVLFSTSLRDPEITRWPLPSPAKMRERIRARNDGSQPLEPWLRLSQVLFEPVVKRLCEDDPRVTMLSGWRLESFEQDGDGVTSTLVESDSGRTQTVRSAFVAGCDGGASSVRRIAEIDLGGTPGVAEVYQVHFRSTATDVVAPFGQFWHNFALAGTLIAQNDADIWTYHAILMEGLPDPTQLEPRAFLHDLFGAEFPCEVLVTSRWRPNLLVANRYRAGRVFLAGDSAHQVIPTGGYGMNTGIGDAVDLGWKLAAMLQGWGGEALLDSYEIERRPVGLRNCDASMQHIGVHLTWKNMLRPEVNDDSADGRACRAEVARFLAEHDDENLSLGLEMGFRYDGSPVVCADDGVEPAWSARDYVPTTWPGGRAPSLFLRDGSALFDRFGPGFTLLELGAEPPSSSAFEAAAVARGVPLRVVAVDDPAVVWAYERRLVLVRPDQHVAWRGDAAPADPLAVIDRVRGAR